MDGPRACLPEEDVEIVDLINALFREGTGQNFRTDYPLLYDSAMLHNRRVIKMDGKVVAHVPVLAREGIEAERPGGHSGAACRHSADPRDVGEGVDMDSSENTGRVSWLDDEGGVALEESVRKLQTFMDAMADGVISEDELAAQEARVVALMGEIEPKLDDGLHAEITRLLVEVTAFDIMNLLASMQAARTKTSFKG